MADSFGQFATGKDSPADHAAVIVPNDATDLTTVLRGVYVGNGGDITLDTVGGETAVLFKAVQSGSVLPIRAQRIRATGTTASNLVGLY